MSTVCESLSCLLALGCIHGTINTVYHLTNVTKLSSSTEEDDLYDVIKDLTPLAARWKDIGIALRLRSGELDKIDSDNPNRCLSYVIENWLKRNYNVRKFGQPTWKWLVDIVADPAAGNDKALANTIARNHQGKHEKGR